MAEKIADLGTKLLYALTLFMLTCMITLGFQKDEANAKTGQKNTVSIAVMEERTKYIISALDDIKDSMGIQVKTDVK